MLGQEAVLEDGAVGRDRAGVLARWDEAEFERFYSAHGRQLRGYIARMCGNATLAEDLFQRAFVRFLQAPLREADERQLKAYLYRIATNLVFDHWREHRREELQWAPDPVTIEPQAILRADMERVFARLNERERAMLWLAHVEGYEHDEIAGILGVGRASVKVLLFRARRKLARHLTDEGMGGGR